MNDEINISNDRDFDLDDAEGHAMRGKGTQPAEDTQGHGFRRPAPEVNDEDTDGHRYKGFRSTPAGEDDTDGHAMRSGRVTPAEDDTDGHAARPGR